MVRRVFLVFALVLLSGSAAIAEAPRRLAWQDLLPKGAEPADPLAHLTMNQRIELRLLAAAQQREDLGMADSDDRSKIAARNLSRKLRDEGLDVDTLLVQFAAYRSQVMARDRMADAGLDGQTVSLPGYMLPLTISDAGVTEFLLVPFIGACIHVPPPPPNQIVFVRAQEPFTGFRLFMTVRVTGRMTVEAATRNLSLVDGTAPVAAAYTIDAALVDQNTD